MTKSEDIKEWLENIKPGDVVCVNSYHWGSTKKYFKKVLRTTKTKIVLSNDVSYRRKDGSQVGSSHVEGSEIKKPTQEDAKEIRLEMNLSKLFRLIQEIKVSGVYIDNDSVEQIIKIIEDSKSGESK